MCAPEHPFALVLGGAKVSDKLPMLERLLPVADVVCLGGAMANAVLKAQGLDLGSSLVDGQGSQEAAERLLRELERRSDFTFVLPSDVVVTSGSGPEADVRVVNVDQVPPHWGIVDVGPNTIDRFEQAIRRARTAIWNGPMGVFERPPFDRGTRSVATMLGQLGTRTVVGGGETTAAVHAAGMTDRFWHVSTGGGATLHLLGGQPMPGLEALPRRRVRAFIAVDDSSHGEVVVQTAARLLRRAERPVIRLATVIGTREMNRAGTVPRGAAWSRPGALPPAPATGSPGDKTPPLDYVRDEVEQRLSHLVTMHLRSYEAETQVEVAEAPDAVLLSEAANFGADLLILGTHGRTGLRRMVLGSVAQAVAQRARVPVVLVRESMPAPVAAEAPLQFLLPTDGSQRVIDAIPAVADIAVTLGAEVTVVQALEPHHLVIASSRDAQRRAAEREVDQLVGTLSAAGMASTGIVIEGSPARGIVREAQERGTELVVIPARSRSEAGRLIFGSVADRVIHDAPCPVVMINAAAEG
jgi:nucleotide-binding universal stress UspA family protein